MTFASYDTALKQVVTVHYSRRHDGRASPPDTDHSYDLSKDTDYHMYLATLTADEKLQLTKSAMSTLLGATVL